jgi:hypothetical protein
VRAASGAALLAQRGRLVLDHAGASHDLGAINDLPLTFNGAATYNLMNLAAAALAAVAGLALSVDAVRATLASFGLDPRDNTGRLERHIYRGATVLIDYAHNPDGLSRLLAVARALPHKRLLLLLGQAGNRSDEAIAELARTAAAARPDLVVIKELANMLRGRPPGEVPALLHRALLDAGLAEAQLQLGGDEIASALMLMQAARSGDVLVLPLHSAGGRSEIAQRLGHQIDAGQQARQITANEQQRENLIEALVRSDGERRAARAQRIRWVSQYDIRAGVIIGEVELMNLLREAQECFVDGHYIATLLLATALIERVIAEELERVGKATPGLSFERAIKLAGQESLFPEALLASADQLRIRRNPFAHRKPSEHEHTLGNRYLAQRRHPRLVLEEDARSAIVAMYGHFKHTLRA